MVHQDPEHDSNELGVFDPVGQLSPDNWAIANQGYDVWLGSPFILIQDGSTRRNLLSEEEIDGMCSEGNLGMAHCNHPGRKLLV